MQSIKKRVRVQDLHISRENKDLGDLFYQYTTLLHIREIILQAKPFATVKEKQAVIKLSLHWEVL